jgi:hypothetical protein
MRTSDVRSAVEEAKATLRAADNVASDFAYLLQGRLRSVYSSYLRELKKELKNFNSRTGEWND